MKTKEEIEQLYHKIWDDFSNKYDDNLHYYSFVEGYTQCQEDMTKDVEYWQGEFDHWHQQAMEMSNKYKYTEEDMKKAFDSGYDIRSSYGDRDDNMTAEQYIISLNKQD